ncbi:MAG: arsenite methyltransferase [Thermoanaerobaculia bacterium]|nr:MAG: arsenite methyltransferase [Thermoanaerobaculia bacterium]
MPRTSLPVVSEEVVEKVRDRYGRIAAGEISGCGCSCGGAGEAALSQEIGYSADDLAALPEEANLGLGCGAPLAHLALVPGETVLDLGSGAGIDAFLAARAVGEGGRVIGVDMTPEMLARARAAAERHGFANVEFREGRLEALPVADASIDAVTSNCVINLVPDKAAVFREVARVLKPGGRLVVSDIVLERPLPAALANDLLAWVGCVGGAELRADYFGRLAAAGLSGVEILRDADYAASLAAAAPEEAGALLDRAGLALEDIAGTVRSITYRALKPAR